MILQLIMLWYFCSCTKRAVARFELHYMLVAGWAVIEGCPIVLELVFLRLWKKCYYQFSLERQNPFLQLLICFRWHYREILDLSHLKTLEHRVCCNTFYPMYLKLHFKGAFLLPGLVNLRRLTGKLKKPTLGKNWTFYEEGRSIFIIDKK